MSNLATVDFIHDKENTGFRVQSAPKKVSVIQRGHDNNLEETAHVRTYPIAKDTLPVEPPFAAHFDLWNSTWLMYERRYPDIHSRLKEIVVPN